MFFAIVRFPKFRMFFFNFRAAAEPKSLPLQPPRRFHKLVLHMGVAAVTRFPSPLQSTYPAINSGGAVSTTVEPSADTNGGGQTVVCKIALHKKNVKLRNETLPLHKKNCEVSHFVVTRPPLAIVASLSDGAPQAVPVAKNYRRL